MEKITLSGNWDLIASGPGIITIRSAVAFDYITVAAGTLPSEITGASTHGTDDILSIETVAGQVVYVRGAMGASAFVFSDHPAARTQVQIPPAPSSWNWDVRPSEGSGNEIVVNRMENAMPAIMSIEYTVDGGETATELPGLVGTHAVPEQKGLDWAYQIRNISGGGQSPWSSVKTPIYGGPVLGLAVVPDPVTTGGAFTITVTVPAGGTLSTVAATAGGTPITLTGSGNTRTGTAPAEAGPLVVTATGEDADGNPLTANRTVQVQEEPVAPTAPGQFAASDWDVTTGPAAGEIVLNITSLPSNGGSPFTAFEQTFDGGSTWTALSGTGTGSRTLTMPAAGTAYTFAIRAVNAVGAGAASASKSATSGAAHEDSLLNAPNVIILGASHTASTFGSTTGELTEASTGSALASYNAFRQAGFTGRLWMYGIAGANIAGGAGQIAAARANAAIANEDGKNLYIVDLGGNSVQTLDFATALPTVTSNFNAMVDAVSAYGDKVVLLPQTKRFATWNGLTAEMTDAEVDASVKGMKVWNDALFTPRSIDVMPELAGGPTGHRINLYEISDGFRDMLSDGNHGYTSHDYAPFVFNRIANVARGISAQQSKAGSAAVFGIRVGTNAFTADTAASGIVQAAATSQAYYGLVRTDGSPETEIGLRLTLPSGAAASPELQSWSTSIAASTVQVDDRFKYDSVLGRYTRISTGTAIVGKLVGLTPGDKLRLSAAAGRSTYSASNSAIELACNGNTAQFYSSNASGTLAQQATLPEVIVPANGELEFTLTNVGTGNGFVGGVMFEFV